MCLKLTIKTPERRQLRRSGDFIVNLEYISKFTANLNVYDLANMYTVSSLGVYV